MTIRFTEKEWKALVEGRKVHSYQVEPQQRHIVIAGGYRSHVSGWRTIGSKRHFFRSHWEINYAHYLEWLKGNKSIHEWMYEPTLFRFPTDKYKAAPFYYKPDFKVYSSKTKYRWYEVKGVLNPKSKKKIKRFEKHFPEEGKIIIVGPEFFKEGNKKFRNLVPGWEVLKQSAFS